MRINNRWFNPLTRIWHYSGIINIMRNSTSIAYATIVVISTRNQTNCHAFNPIRPIIKVFIYYYSPLNSVQNGRIGKMHPPSGRLKQTKRNLSSSYSLHGATKTAITQPSLVVRTSGRVHFIPHVILHLMKYRLSILNKNGSRYGESKVHFSENEAVLFIAS